MSWFCHPMSRASIPTRHQHTLPALLLLLCPLALVGCQGWPTQGGPTQGSTTNELTAVAALSPDDIWAVGGISTPKHFDDQVLIEHWDGGRWQNVMLVPAIDGELCALSANSPTDIWAVGSSRSCSGPGHMDSHLLVMRWDGQSWRQVVVPEADASPEARDTFTAVAALSATNVWAVGASKNEALIEHWDGAQWAVVPQPFHGLSLTLQAITARVANDMWTVGFAVDTDGDRFSLTEHWDGNSWQVVPMPQYAQDARLLGDPDFVGIAAFPPGQLWAVGEIDLSSVYQATPLIERWNGTRWQVVYGSAPSQPSPSKPGAMLQAVAAVDAQDAWAVGNASIQDAKTFGKVLVVHWNGQSWQQVNAPSFSVTSQLSALAVVSASDIWAVGSTTLDYGGNSQTLIEHWNGSQWQSVPSPNPGMPGPPKGSG